MIKWIVALGYAIYLAKTYTDNVKKNSTVVDKTEPTVTGVRG